MRKRCFGPVLAIVAGVALVSLAQGSATAQAPLTTVKAWEPARTPDGQPDIQGFWGTDEYAGSLETGFRDPVTVKIQGGRRVGSPAALAAGKPVSLVVDPPDGKIPYQPWAEARRREIRSRYGATGTPLTARDVGPELSCTIGLPRIVYFAESQVVQTPGQVLMSWERTREYRVIPLDGRPPLPSSVKLHMGDARGHWEGNTLVVNTANLNDWSWFDGSGSIHTDAMSLVERFTPVDPNTLKYQVTVTDPKAFTRPWTMVFNLKRGHAEDKNYELLENSCAEGERALATLLGGESPR